MIRSTARGVRLKTDHVPFSEIGPLAVTMRSMSDIHPSAENNHLYRPVNPDDPVIIELADSIRQHGLLEPLVVSRDGYIISGHRRYAACRLAGLIEVPVRIVQVECVGNEDQFVRLLREHNRQRDKSLDEKVREELVTADPEEAYESLIAHRRQASTVTLESIEVREGRGRSKIYKAKKPFLRAILQVLEDQKDFLPLSDRRIHYALLNDPPLIHASKPDSRYTNTPQAYKSLVDLVTRARLIGVIAFDAIADETRPVTVWSVHDDPRSFIKDQANNFLKGYWRNLQRSQPCHIEVLVEKNTAAPILRPVCAEYCIPMTSARGYSSLPPRYDMAKRFRLSGKDRLVILIVTDHDPDGEEIAHSFARSMQEDFRVNATAIKVALTAEQIRDFNLPPIMEVKKTGSRAPRFRAAHGDVVHELEALPPAALQSILRTAIDSVIDRDLFDREIDAERQDAAFLANKRQLVHLALRAELRQEDSP